MNDATPIIVTPPAMKSQDFAFLREEGMQFLRSVAAESWTDHNLHDPGITLLEAFCYAVTEMGLRSGMDMRDLIASDISGHQQELYTAAEILPVSPIALRDFRKVLIDHPLVQNAWLFPLSTEPRGRLSVLLEFAESDLNSNTFSIIVHPLPLGQDYNIDLAFPYWDDADAGPFAEDVTFTGVTFDMSSGNAWNQIEGSDAYFARINVSYQPAVGPPGVRLLWVVAQVTTPMDNPLTDLPFILPELSARVTSIIDNSPTDLALVHRFNNRVRDANNAMRVVRRYLKDYRNLCEDFFDYKAVRLQEVAVSAIIDVNPGVLLEDLLADIFFAIDRFIAPVNHLGSLDALLSTHAPDAIFEGPSMDTGFLQDGALSTTALPDVLYTSDILRLILQQRDQRGTDIVQREDVSARNITAVRNLSLANYLDNRPITSNARDCLHLVESQRHIPRLSLTKSRITFFRSGAEATYDLQRVIELVQGRKAAELLEETTMFEDIPLPAGEQFATADYYPIQNDLPLVYGVGEAGLPETATAERKALALQLKGYLFFFEQLTAGLAGQLSNINAFFSADPDLEQTLFPQPLYHLPEIRKLLRHFDLQSGNWENFQQDADNGYVAALAQSAESREQFLARRNRLLNHLLAVFGEDMYDTAALAYHKASIVPDSMGMPLDVLLARQAEQRNAASRQMIRRKSAFLHDLPALNRDRAQAYGNLLWRTDRLLQIQATPAGFTWTISDAGGTALLRGVTPEASAIACRRLAAEVSSLATVAGNYDTIPAGPDLRLIIKRTPADTQAIAESIATFASPALAATGRDNTVLAITGLWVSFALTPLEERLYHMLGIAIKERRTVVHATADYFEVFDQPPNPPIRKRFRMWERPLFTGAELLTGQVDYTAATDPLAIAAAQAGMQTVISRGTDISNYEITNPAANIFRVMLLASDGTVLARAPLDYATQELAKEALQRILQHIFRLFSMQGFYLIEHLLLFPVTTGGTALNMTETPDAYSFQISFVFPSGYGRDFSVPASPRVPVQPEGWRDPEFRKLAEQQVRKACPAHIMPRILWVDSALPGTPVTAADPSFTNFEIQYRAWLSAYLADEPQESVIAPLRDQLAQVIVNIYTALES